MAAYGRSFGHVGALPHTCRVCLQEEAAEDREEWGCDTETPEAQFLIPCVHCAGGGRPECPVCEGTGEEEVHRCPHAIVEEWANEYLLLHRAWPKALLQPGGIGDQPAVYVDAMWALDVAKGRIEREAAEEAKRRAERPPAPGAPGGRR